MTASIATSCSGASSTTSPPRASHSARLANIALRDGEDAAVGDVVMDEFHWYADRDRGVAWQVPLLTLPQARFATLGDVAFFEEAR
jgi:hypothetical protein